MNFQFQLNPEAFMQTLPIMGYGMLGIFAVMLIIYLSIVLLLKIFGGKPANQPEHPDPDKSEELRA